MNTPTNILTDSVRVDNYYLDWHLARNEAARRIAYSLAHAFLRKEFSKPTIVLMEMAERRDNIINPDTTLITGRLVYQSFTEWAKQNLCASEEVHPFGKIIPIPLSDQYMMAENENRIPLK